MGLLTLPPELTLPTQCQAEDMCRVPQRLERASPIELVTWQAPGGGEGTALLSSVTLSALTPTCVETVPMAAAFPIFPTTGVSLLPGGQP